ncbi:uncharacterized protein LTR77_007420 [Saxophila tyrrhenica]|uniref:XPG N-terminal domain-containing protein n=1 Tax=Saxophila tyrrhenica TaxID=1690608 RepID=A0AAV9P6K9_9PEZI|nr:hypothetical protein LTR77_007420 [Saxophila tyrrhenica]
MGSNAFAFKTWAITENVITTSTPETFNDTRIGIDAEDYLHSLLITGNREPLLPALGGKPFCLLRRVDEGIEGFKAAGIDPVFVFNGLDLACRDRASILRESRKASMSLDEAWQIYDQGRGEDAVLQFGKACTYRSYHIVRSLQFHLHSKGVDIMTAPYAAAAQLAYMLKTEQIDAVQGSASCLLFGTGKVIFSFEWEKDSVVWLDVRKCLAKLEVDFEQFTNICLISGCGILSLLPDLDIDNAATKIIAARVLLQNMNFDVDRLLRSKNGDYHKLFWQARFALRYPVVVKEEGEVEPLNWREGPSDAHEFIGQRLPDELYFYLSRGVAGPRVLNWRTRMEILETPPLDGGDSTPYKDLVQTKLKPLRAQAVALMGQSLNRYYQKQDVKLLCWWHELSTTPLGTTDIANPGQAAQSWHVNSALLSQLSGGSSTPSMLSYAINTLADPSEAKKTVTPRVNGTTQLHDVADLRANVVWRFLNDRGYLNSDHTLSAWGKALKAAFSHEVSTRSAASPEATTELEEAIFMAFELLRLGLLDRRVMFPVPPFSGGPIRGSDQDKAQIQLVSRVACLGFLRHKSIGYTGPLSRNLLAYHQCTAATRGALRDLLEMHACNMLLSGVVDRNLDNNVYTDVAASLPLVDEPDIGLALIVKCYLDELCQPFEKRVAISGWFPHAEDIQGDLQKAWNLWGAINAGVQAAEFNIVNNETKKTFQAADTWLKEKLEQANGPNGTTNGVTNGTTNGTA